MGDEPLLPLNTYSFSKIRSTIAQTAVSTADRRQQETIAEMWPEISFRNKEQWLGILLSSLRQHFKKQLKVSMVRNDKDIRFLLEDSDSLAAQHLTLEEACQVLGKAPDHNGQLLDYEC